MWDALKDYLYEEDVDLLDAHSFLWTTGLPVLNEYRETDVSNTEMAREKRIEEGSVVIHKEYGEGTIEKLSDENVYVMISGKRLIFPYPKSFEKQYLRLK